MEMANASLDRLLYQFLRKGDISFAKFGDSCPLNFGNDKDVAVQWTGSLLTVIPLTDDTGAINVGNGTKDIDLKVFLGTTAKYVLFDVGNARVELAGTPLRMSGTFADHIFYVPNLTLSSGKRVIRIGDYGTEFSLAAGNGIIRTYCTIASGTDDTAFQFHWGLTTTAACPIGSQMQIESAAGSPGPKAVRAHDFIVGIQDTKYLAAATDVTHGLCATWHKVYAPVGAVCSGDVFPIFLNNEVNCTVSGTEASIKASCGGTVPDGFVWLHTTSGGWASLFYFDSTMASKPPLGTGSLKNSDATDIKCDKYIINNINGTPYYIPLYDTLN
jgi:hypothetical protein